MEQLRQPETPGLASPPGFLLNTGALLVLLSVLLLAAWTGQTPVVVLTGLFLSAAGIAKGWSRISLLRIACSRGLSRHRAFPGETLELDLRLTNRKPVPLPWVQVDHEIPADLFSGTMLLESPKPGFSLLRHRSPVLWYSRIAWKSRLVCSKRGYTRLGPISVTSGDIFGFYPRTAFFRTSDEVIIYPRIYPVKRLILPSPTPLGESISNIRLFQDPTRACGLREYRPNDSLRHVHWKASARHQQLQIRVFEPTTTLKTAIFLAVDTFRDENGFKEEAFELGISAAASLAHHLLSSGNPAGLFVNTRSADSGEAVRLRPGGSPGHHTRIFESLAKTSPVSGVSFDAFFEEQLGALGWGISLVLVVSNPSASLPFRLKELKERGFSMLVLRIDGAAAAFSENGVPVRHIVSPDDLLDITPEESR
jgi:uncharacterized protein (DUF58 family)